MGERDCSGRPWLHLSTAERSRGLPILMQRWDNTLGKPNARIRSGLCHCLSNFTASLLGIYGALWYYQNASVWCCLCCICPLVLYSTENPLISPGCVLLGVTHMVNEPVGNLLKKKEVISTPFTDVISVGALILVLSRLTRSSWKPGIEMEGHETTLLWLQVLLWGRVGACVCPYRYCATNVHELNNTTLKRIS